VSIKDVAEMIAEAFEFKGKLLFDTTKSDGQYKKTVPSFVPTILCLCFEKPSFGQASNAKLLRLNPDVKFLSMKEGIKRLENASCSLSTAALRSVEWFKANYDTLRK
jgi:GDP-L-fucose synthase